MPTPTVQLERIREKEVKRPAKEVEKRHVDEASAVRVRVQEEGRWNVGRKRGRVKREEGYRKEWLSSRAVSLRAKPSTLVSAVQ